MTRILCLLSLCVIAACGDEGAYPALVPLQEITGAATTVTVTPETAQGVEDRAAALRTRADGLRGPVLAPADRARLRP